MKNEKFEENDEFLLEKEEIKPLDGKSLISLKLLKTDEFTAKSTSNPTGNLPITTINTSTYSKPVTFTMEPSSFSPEETFTMTTPPMGTRIRRLSHSDRSWSTSRIPIQQRKVSLPQYPASVATPVQSPAQSFCTSFNRQATFTSLVGLAEDEYTVGDTIADYKLVKVLGSGANSQVFLASTSVKPR